MEAKQMKLKLQSALSNKRYKHSLGVANECITLAKLFGEDVEKAEIAGLLHDCAKDIPNPLKLTLCKENHIKLNKAMKQQPDLTHSFLGAVIAKKEYGISDDDILDAITYHTTGRPKMSKLEKIVYLADFIEPNREDFKGLDKIRKLSYENLDEAMAYALKKSLKFVEKKDSLIHELTVEAYEYYK